MAFNLLIVDDSGSVRKVTRNLLERGGAEDIVKDEGGVAASKDRSISVSV